jgi:two-component system response regulator YesN
VEAGRILYDARPDLLIIEVEMPYLNGLEFAALMMDDATVPQIPIILITSHERFREQAQIIGVDCLIKPFFADQLLEAVARGLERKTSMAVVP